MFGSDHLSNRARIHPLQDFETAIRRGRHDATQHATGFVFANRSAQHILKVIDTAADIRLLFDGSDKAVEYRTDRFLR